MTHFFRPSEALDKSLIEVGDLVCRKAKIGGKMYDWYYLLMDDNEVNVINGNPYIYMKFVSMDGDFQEMRITKHQFMELKQLYLVAKADKSAMVNP